MITRREFRFHILVLGILLGGCAPALVKPQASDWSRRDLDGVSLEAPYAFTGHNNALPGFVNVASYKPDKPNTAIDIRVDVLQPPVGEKAITLDQFANSMFALVDANGERFLTSEVIKSQIDGIDTRKNMTTNHKNGIVQGLVFKKGEFYWLIEVYYKDASLEGDAKRVIESVKMD